MQAMVLPLVQGCSDLASEPLSAARSRRNRCMSLRHRRFITRHLHRFTSGRPFTSHLSTLGRGITGVRIEVIDASDLQPLVGVSMRNPASSRGRGSLNFRVRGLRYSLALSCVWIMGAALTGCSSESADMTTASLGERWKHQQASDACNSAVEKRRWGTVSAMLSYKPREPDHGYRRCVESKLNKADPS